ncbi:MAG TPA: hypothetical protein P5137_08140, partial [Candidatus Brocadiia bacterium]|nr:hypothetical protein [Candidatus Brocadiia bacterium]
MSAMAKCGVCGVDTPVAEGEPPENVVCAACKVVQAAAPVQETPTPEAKAEEDDGVRVTLQEALFGLPTGRAAAGYLCHGCGAAIRGVEASKDAYMSSAGLSQFPVSGYQCGACGALFCVACKMGVLQWSSWGGFDRSVCPKCKEPFRPSSVVLDGDPAAV